MALEIGKIIRFMTVRTTEGIVVLLLIMFMPNIPPYCKISDPKPVTPSKPLEGNLALNQKLNDLVIWHKGDLYGAEAFADYDGILYTSLHNGEIVKFVGEDIIPVVKFGKPCKGFHEEKICGRPLGMEFDKDGSLVALDAYYGMYRVDVNTGEKIQLISLDDEIDGKKPKLPNALAIASNGDIYWSDSSTEFHLEDGVFDMFADGSGRLIHYDIKTKNNTVLIDDLLFANGVALSDDEEFVLVVETGRSCVHRYYLKGPKKGTRDIFIDGLPGLPDNINSDGQGGFFFPLIAPRDDYTPIPTQILGSFPLFRKLVARMLGLGELGFKLANQMYQMELFERAIHLIGHFSVMSLVLPRRVTIVHASKTGEIIGSLHANNRKALGISEAYIFNGELFLGSPLNDFVARISLNKVGLDHLIQKRGVPETKEPPTVTTVPPPPKPTTAAPTSTTPKPTTAAPTSTTPKPTTAAPPTPTTPKPTTTPSPTPKATTPPPPTTTPKPTTAAPPPPKATTTAPPPPSKATTTTPPPPPKATTAAPPPSKATTESTTPPTPAPTKPPQVITAKVVTETPTTTKAPPTTAKPPAAAPPQQKKETATPPKASEPTKTTPKSPPGPGTSGKENAKPPQAKAAPPSSNNIPK